YTVPCTSNFPLRSGKGSLYEGGIRVPLLIRWPGAAAAQRNKPLVTCDLFFTLLAIAGLAPATQQPPDGLDLSPLIRGEKATLARELLHSHSPHHLQT